MRTYVVTTGVLFGLLALIHIWRAIVEGPHLATDPWYVLITLVAAAPQFLGLATDSSGAPDLKRSRNAP